MQLQACRSRTAVVTQERDTVLTAWPLSRSRADVQASSGDQAAKPEAEGPNHSILLKLSIVAWALSIALRTEPGENSKYDFSIEK